MSVSFTLTLIFSYDIVWYHMVWTYLRDGLSLVGTF